MFETIADQGPAGVLAAMTEHLAKLPSQLWRTENDGFASIAAAIDALAVQVDCTRVGLVQEAQSRGVVSASSSSTPADWLMANSFHLEPSDAARTADLARACAQPANQIMAAAVAGGTLTVRKAVTALRQLNQVEHALAPGKREEALASLTQMAQTGYDRNVIAVGRALMSLVGADRALERDEDALRALSSLRLFPLENGMLRVSGQLDPEAGAVLTAALDPLTAPHPAKPQPAGPTKNPDIGWADPQTGRDLRPADRRRAEALIEICRRAAAAGRSAPKGTKATLIVLINNEHLTGRVQGYGRALDGTVVSPETVRKMGCDASIIPVVLGSKGQPLDVGRLKRLVTQSMQAALWIRDKGCTFPGCGRPPQWCDAHHVIHWVDGGPTCLLNLALLCAHHPPPRFAGGTPTYVHQHDLTATVTAFGVIWQT